MDIYLHTHKTDEYLVKTYTAMQDKPVFSIVLNVGHLTWLHDLTPNLSQRQERVNNMVTVTTNVNAWLRTF